MLRGDYYLVLELIWVGQVAFAQLNNPFDDDDDDTDDDTPLADMLAGSEDKKSHKLQAAFEAKDKSPESVAPSNIVLRRFRRQQRSPINSNQIEPGGKRRIALSKQQEIMNLLLQELPTLEFAYAGPKVQVAPQAQQNQQLLLVPNNFNQVMQTTTSTSTTTANSGSGSQSNVLTSSTTAALILSTSSSIVSSTNNEASGANQNRATKRNSAQPLNHHVPCYFNAITCF